MNIEVSAALFRTVKLLSLRQDDIVVFRSYQTLSADHLARFTDLLRNEFPGHHVLVLDRGADFDIISRGEASADDVVIRWPADCSDPVLMKGGDDARILEKAAGNAAS